MDFFKSKTFIILVILVFLAGGVIALAVSSSKTDAAQNTVGVLITPLQEGVTSVRNSIEKFFAYFREFDKLKEENQTLSQQVQDLQVQLSEYDKYKNENQRLLDLLEMKTTNAHLNVEIARVIAREAGNWSTLFIIDKGTASGIETKDMVITKEGLVGFVIEAGATWAKVSTIIEPETAIGASIISTGDVGIVEGSFDLMQNRQCKLSYLSRNANIKIDDFVETSGLGDTYPRGIIIGKIVSTVMESHGVSQYAIVEPAVDFDSLKEVMVIKSFEQLPNPPAEQTDNPQDEP